MAGTHGDSFGDIILHHVTNDPGQVYFPIHLLGMDISITKHVIMLWIVAFITVTMAIWGTRIYRRNAHATPKGLSHLYEILMNFIRNDIVNKNIGEKEGRFWTPLITTYFVFILTANIMGLIPVFEFLPGGSATVTGNFAVTVALATITFFAIILAGSMKHGFIGYWKHMIPGNVPWPVLFILIPIEIMGMFIRPLALTLRLGANMTAGHIGMVAIFGLPILLQMFAVGFISTALNVGIFFLEIIVSLVQAYVFTLLSSVFIGMAIHAEH